MLCCYFITHYIVFPVISGMFSTDSIRGQHPNGAAHSNGAPLETLLRSPASDDSRSIRLDPRVVLSRGVSEAGTR